MITKLNIRNPQGPSDSSYLQPQLPQARSHKRAVHTQHQNSFSFSFFNVLFFFDFIIYLYCMLHTLGTYGS